MKVKTTSPTHLPRAAPTHRALEQTQRERKEGKLLLDYVGGWFLTGLAWTLNLGLKLPYSPTCPVPTPENKPKEEKDFPPSSLDCVGGSLLTGLAWTLNLALVRVNFTCLTCLPACPPVL